MKSRCANFEILVQDPDYILINDLGPWDMYPTITNSVEEVVKKLAYMLNGRRLYYIDSDGDRTELIVKDGKFVRFNCWV